jgi:DNA-binding SARP family transcriptional activator/tetratricopeptide (TPR) repeat protein
MARRSEFRALGPVAFWSDGRRQDLGSARARSILAILLLTPRTVVPAETLIDRLWENNPPPKARKNLSVYMARLRASLRQAAGDEVQLVPGAGGYMLDVDPETVDVHQFRQLRRQADRLAASGDRDRAADALREADGLWRGQALAGVSGDWIARMRDGLEEERRAAILERVGYELELGRHADLVGELGHLLAQYPLDETLVGHQMTALYWSGRQADALTLYRETRDRLVKEQGAEPGAALAELHQRILGGDTELAVPSPAQRPHRAAAPDTTPPGPAEFVGRSAELAQLTSEHGSRPWIAVIEGMPGVGKTALAVRTARLVSGRYPDGTLYLDLDPGKPLEPAEALHRLLRMLGLPASQIPDTIGERAALWRAQLTRRRMVVILDNAALPDQIRPLLPTLGECLILITSRRRLAGIGSGPALILDVLDPDDAVILFARIAGQDRLGDGSAVTEAVRLCGWLPLAIQLTASRVARDPALSLASLVEEMSQSAVQLGGTGPACPEVTAAFDLSYQALEPDHQRMLRRLGASPCTEVSLQAAAALDGGTLATAEKALGVLLDCHLLTQAPHGQFRFHDLIREYAAVRAARDDSEAERRQAVTRLLDYYLWAADRADRVLHPFRRRASVPAVSHPPAELALGTREDAASWLASESRSLLTATAFAGRHEWKPGCTDLAWLLAEWLDDSACWDEAIVAHRAALQAARELADPARIARAAVPLSMVYQKIGQHNEARRLAEEAAATCRSLDDPGGEADALDQLGLAHLLTTQWREALAYFGEARALYGDAGDQRGIAAALGHAGIACWHLGHYHEAADHQRGSLELYREVGDRRGEAKAFNNLGNMHAFQGFHRDALDAYQRSLDIFEEIGGPQNSAILCHNIGTVHRYKGSLDEALAACRRALGIYRSLGDRPDEADVLNDIGAIYQSGALSDQALTHHQQARVIAEEIGNVYQQLIALRGIADAHRSTGQYDQALDDYNNALRLAREIGEPYEEGKILEGIAETTLSTQQRAAARITYRQALDIYERLGVPEAESARIRLQNIQNIDRAPGTRTSLGRRPRQVKRQALGDLSPRGPRGLSTSLQPRCHCGSAG